MESRTPHSVTITWTPSKSTVAGYYVYRFSSPDDLARVSSGIVTATQYTDKTVEGGKTYTYYVKSVDSRGAESPPSERIRVKVPGGWFPPFF
jgi:fibronectin type 3 domain-containing protein